VILSEIAQRSIDVSESVALIRGPACNDRLALSARFWIPTSAQQMFNNSRYFDFKLFG